MGWVNYFKIADMKKLLQTTDEWMRRRIRMIYWKQWKRIRTRFKMLKLFGVQDQKAWEYANTTGEPPIVPSSPNPSETTRSKDSVSYSFQIIIDKSLRKLRNRRIPNGTYGGVGGRLLK
ncbi:group II intron maturase-specific domain-containing protein [Brevibacillus invocatus]|uniref:group II intron maturase-specific domain-containing protein n=1 Tax=Brevibacillus invocatus TaxID=173959 RepID=UPI0039A2612C